MVDYYQTIMDFNVEIEYWEDNQGVSPVVNFIKNLPAEHQAWIVKKNEFFEGITMSDLMRSQFF